MATRQGSAIFGALEIADLSYICEILNSINAKYHSFGLQIEVDPDAIDRIERDYKISQERLREVLKDRLKMIKPLTWSDICNALGSDMVGECKLADEIWSSFMTPIPHFKHQKRKKVVKKRKAVHDEEQYGDLNEVKQPKSCNVQKAKRIGDGKCQHKVKEKSSHATVEDKAYVKSKQKKMAKVSQDDVGTDAEHCHLESEISDVGPKLEGSMQIGSESDSYVTCSEGEQEVAIASVYQKIISSDFQEQRKLMEGSAEINEAASVSEASTMIISYYSESKSKDSNLVNSNEGDESRSLMSNEEITRSSDDSVEVKTKLPVIRKNIKTYTKRAAAVTDSDNSSEEQERSAKKNRSKTRTRESCSRPRATGRSSPHTLNEVSQLKACPRRQSGEIEQETSIIKFSRKTSTSFTESEESSEEFDNFSPTEKINLSKAFQHCFGKLCRNISNPEEIGSELQLRGILSNKFMCELLMSAEPQQTNVIYLVNTLDEIVKLHPVKIFTIIKVLLINPFLQESGWQMWKEAGRVCSARTRSVLGSKSPPPPTTQPAIQEHGGNTEYEAVPKPTRISSCNEHSGKSLSDMPQPFSALHPVLQKYREYLQSCYNAKALAPADKYIPTLKTPYINLALIKGGSYSPKSRKYFTRNTLHGEVDEILNEKLPIKTEDILTAEDSSKPVRFVLVEGPPGIGKSTFAWEVCRRWHEIESFKNYHIMVLLKLREKWVLNATKPLELFRFPPDPDYSKAIAEVLNESHGSNLLLVLDGFDEVSHSFHENSVIKSILCRTLLPKCSIILTTRPVAKHALQKICQPQWDKHVEIVGFTENERVSYITEAFSKKPELQANFLKNMFLVPQIKSMMYIPLNCAIIAKVYHEYQMNPILAFPRTKTQLYNALTHCLLVRHVGMDNASMLPENLSKRDMDDFKILAKFAFDSYHSESTKVTFFKDNMPKRFVHFGFMNECTEMYASSGVEQTFTFLHLSLQEYLAAWHIAYTHSIEFQVVYHSLAVGGCDTLYEGSNDDEKACILSLKAKKISVLEPAKFLAGITGWKSQPGCDQNHWERYLSHDTRLCGNNKVLLCSLYESQNPAIVPHYFMADSDKPRKEITVDSHLKPYDCYSLSYCVAHCTEKLILNLNLHFANDTSHIEMFVKGVKDHCKGCKPIIKELGLLLYTDSTEDSSKFMFWITKPEFPKSVEKLSFTFKSMVVKANLVLDFLQSLPSLQSVVISVDWPSSWEWLAALSSLKNLQLLHINSIDEYWGIPPTNYHCWPKQHQLKELVFDLDLVLGTRFQFHTRIDDLVGIVLKSVLRSNVITKLILPNVSRETMSDICSIILHCPSLTKLEMKRTRLGYDGILYICSALINNTSLTHLLIHDDTQPPFEYYFFDKISKCDFSSKIVDPLPTKITCTDFLLELNNILKSNCTLEELSIWSDPFLPLSGGCDGEFYQWTGFGPLQHFNGAAVASGMSPRIRRSYSLSDLNQSQTILFWDRNFDIVAILEQQKEIDEVRPWHDTMIPRKIMRNKKNVKFDKYFMMRKMNGDKLFSLPSFTAPDTEMILPFTSLDSRLQDCLEISHLDDYVYVLGMTFNEVMRNISKQVSSPDKQLSNLAMLFIPRPGIEAL